MTTTMADPFAALEQAAKRQKAEEDATAQISKGLVKLILGKDAKSPFFATLALRQRLQANWDIPTACVDGRTLEYNPDFICGLSLPETIGLLAHEVMHLAHKHHCRQGGREHQGWNIATDLEINGILKQCGFTLPSGGLFPGQGQFSDMPLNEAAERYYDLLPKDKDQGGCDGDGDGPSKPGTDPGGCGGVKPAGDKAQQAQAAAEMDVAVMQAAEACKGRGTLPGGLDRLIQSIAKPKVDWRAVLREFVSAVARNDYSWTPPNRRYVHMGLYLPSLRSEELGDVLLAIDTSGSIGKDELEAFAAEAQGIFETYACTVTILYHDTRVARVETWEPSDGDLKLRPAGGGGTSHRCVFDHVDREGWTPTVMVALSDMDSDYPSLPPEYPVIWARIGGHGTIPTWGRLIDIEA